MLCVKDKSFKNLRSTKRKRDYGKRKILSLSTTTTEPQSSLRNRKKDKGKKARAREWLNGWWWYSPIVLFCDRTFHQKNNNAQTHAAWTATVFGCVRWISTVVLLGAGFSSAQPYEFCSLEADTPKRYYCDHVDSTEMPSPIFVLSRNHRSGHAQPSLFFHFVLQTPFPPLSKTHMSKDKLQTPSWPYLRWRHYRCSVPRRWWRRWFCTQ